MTIDVEKVLALVREVADPRWADPVCSMGDMVTLTLDEMIAFADRVAARERATLAAEPAQPVAWRSWTGQCGYGYWESQTDADLHSDPDYRPVPLYTADAIREAVLAEREACASLIEPKNPRSDWTEYAEAKADCAAMIRARGAA